MTNQEIFDYVAPRLLKQTRKSTNIPIGKTDALCGYRDMDNPQIRCAIGFLIPDDDYTLEFEGPTIIEDGPPRKYFESRGFDLNFLMQLQDVHDKKPLFMWQSELLKLARNFGLNSSILEECIA